MWWYVVMVRHLQAGMSLIELMVTVAIVTVLALLSLPLTQAWVDNAHLNYAEDTLYEGYSTARALALQNPGNVTGPAVAASLVLVDNTLQVSLPPAGSEAVWTGRVDSRFTLSLTTGDCNNNLAFTNNGLPTDSDCRDYRILKGSSERDTGTLE